MEGLALDISPLTESKTRGPSVAPTHLAELLPSLRRLDWLLEHAMLAMAPTHCSDGSPLFRGLYISRDEVARLLSKEPGSVPFTTMGRTAGESADLISAEESPLLYLTQKFNLSRFDADVLLASLAPEIDLRKNLRVPAG
jgi:hypothetical protein